jgi:predicted alpha/beta hydrolase family esterase
MRSTIEEERMQKSVLMVPGIGNSGDGHWQSRWQQSRVGITRIAPSSWEEPECDDWVAAIERAVTESGPQTLIVAHSLGCLAVVHWAARHGGTAAGRGDAAALSARGDGAVGAQAAGVRVAGALLVAVPDPHGPAFPAAARGFAPLPELRLPFPSLIVASDDDPYARITHAERYAAAWGSRLHRIGKRGHINAASGLGDWPAGWQLLESLTDPASASAA